MSAPIPARPTFIPAIVYKDRPAALKWLRDAFGFEVSELLTKHFKLRMQKATQQLSNHSELGKTRRDIARAKTILAQKNKEAAK